MYKISWANNKARMRARIGWFWRNLKAMLGFKNLIPRRRKKVIETWRREEIVFERLILRICTRKRKLSIDGILSVS